MWQELFSGNDSEAQVSYLVEKRTDGEHGYRCCFTPLTQTELRMTTAHFDPLSGELEALEELISRIRTEIMTQ